MTNKLPPESPFYLLFPSALAFSFWQAEGVRPWGDPASWGFNSNYRESVLKPGRTPYLCAFAWGRLYTGACPMKHRSRQSFGWSRASSWTRAGCFAIFSKPSALGLFLIYWGTEACQLVCLSSTGHWPHTVGSVSVQMLHSIWTATQLERGWTDSLLLLK